MNYDNFEDKKKEFDEKLICYFVKRVFEDIGETDAANEDLIDSVGNIINKPDKKNDWAFTRFDKLILSLKNTIGEKYLRKLLSQYSWIKDFDPLFIMSIDKNKDLNKVRKNLGQIVTKMEDAFYLPNGLNHSQEYIEEEKDINFCDKVSKALTIATFLLYALRNEKIPSDIDFTKNIIPSVEITFNVRPFKNYKQCVELCRTNNLTDSGAISKQGIKKIVSIAKYLVDGDILSKSAKRVENQSANWEKLANLSDNYV